MKLAYISFTNNTRKFVNKLHNAVGVEFTLSNPCVEIDDRFLLLIPSYDKELNITLEEFINYKSNPDNLLAVIGSGNINFGDEFCHNAKYIADKYNKKLIYKYEFAGTDVDVKNVMELIEEWKVEK